MSSLPHGKSTLVSEVTHISAHGVWLLTSAGKELFMAFEHFPWFKGQSAQIIKNIEEPSPGHFYWPDIDVDLSQSIIENPKQYPLQA